MLCKHHLTKFSLAEETHYTRCDYNRNINKEIAGYCYRELQVVSSASSFWREDINFFLRFHFLHPSWTVELRHFLLLTSKYGLCFFHNRQYYNK